MARTIPISWLRRGLPLAAALALAGCAMTPEPISDAQRAERTRHDNAIIQQVAFMPTGPVSLAQAITRAIAVNVGVRVKQIEREISEAELRKAEFAMLPGLQINGGYDRTNKKVSNSNDQMSRTASAQLSWNVLDLGLSYARARQAADQTLIARERERKAMQDIIRKVRTAYFRAASAQKLIERVRGVAKEIQVALRSSHELEQRHMQDAVEATAYRREIVGAVRETLFIHRELREAKTELARLLNIPSGVEFQLASWEQVSTVPRLPMTLQDMELYALEMRPELRIEDYNERISLWQSREALFSMLPGLSLSTGGNYSSESVNLTPAWISSGMTLGMNLFSLFAGTSSMDVAERRGELARQQRISLSLAVFAQLHLAHAKFRGASQQLRLSHEIANADRRINHLVRSEKTFMVNDYFETVRLGVRRLESEMDEHRAQVEVITAHSDLMHSIGLDVVPNEIDLADLPAMEANIERVIARWQNDGPAAEGTSLAGLDKLIDGLITDFATPDAPPVRQAATAPPRGEAAAQTEFETLARQLQTITPAGAPESAAETPSAIAD